MKNQNLVYVKNNKSNPRVVPHSFGKTLLLRPGTNPVDGDVWAKVASMPAVKKLVDDGVLKVFNANGSLALESMPIDSAIELIKTTPTRAELHELLSSVKRPSRLHARIKQAAEAADKAFADFEAKQEAKAQGIE